MSRIGRKPFPYPAGVEFKVDDNVVTVKTGTLTEGTSEYAHRAGERRRSMSPSG